MKMFNKKQDYTKKQDCVKKPNVMSFQDFLKNDITSVKKYFDYETSKII